MPAGFAGMDRLWRQGRPAAFAVGVLLCVSVHAADATPTDWCKRLAPRLPRISVAACEHSGVTPTGATSAKGFPILARSVPPSKPRPGEEPLRILLLGAIHGDELTAAAIVFEWMQLMQTSPAREFYWRVAPVVNPDGLLAPKPQRVNANGVDLNRNFPTPDWERDAPHYWRVRTGSNARRFPGREPLSEPETRWLYAEIEHFNPNVIVSVHAPFGVLDFDGPAPTPHKFGRLWFRPLGVYPGSLGNYGGVRKNVPVITIELPNAVTMPPPAEVRRIWQDMLTWIGNNVPPKAPEADAAGTERPLRRTSVH
jgi:hypothetical protein